MVRKPWRVILLFHELFRCMKFFPKQANFVTGQITDAVLDTRRQGIVAIFADLSPFYFFITRCFCITYFTNHKFLLCELPMTKVTGFQIFPNTLWLRHVIGSYLAFLLPMPIASLLDWSYAGSLSPRPMNI